MTAMMPCTDMHVYLYPHISEHLGSHVCLKWYMHSLVPRLSLLLLFFVHGKSPGMRLVHIHVVLTFVAASYSLSTSNGHITYDCEMQDTCVYMWFSHDNKNYGHKVGTRCKKSITRNLSLMPRPSIPPGDETGGYIVHVSIAAKVIYSTFSLSLSLLPPPSQLMLALSCGAALLTTPPGVRSSPSRLASLLFTRQRASVMQVGVHH